MLPVVGEQPVALQVQPLWSEAPAAHLSQYLHSSDVFLFSFSIFAISSSAAAGVSFLCRLVPSASGAMGVPILSPIAGLLESYWAALVCCLCIAFQATHLSVRLVHMHNVLEHECMPISAITAKCRCISCEGHVLLVFIKPLTVNLTYPLRCQVLGTLWHL